MVNFADKPRLDTGFTTDLGVLEAGIARVDAIGGTAMRDAVQTAEDYIAAHASRDRKVLLVITDGRDNASSATLKDIERMFERGDTAVYAIGLFSNAESATAKDGRHELDRLTQHTGGAALYPASVDEITDAVRELARQIRNQYTIAYAPSNQALDGSYRRIRVEARGREPLQVHTRAGYVAAPAREK